MSDSDTDNEPVEYLMNTRERRSNAGNRLQKLLEQEIKDTRARTEALDNDDIDLLFQEDEDDQDFDIESEREEYDEESHPHNLTHKHAKPPDQHGEDTGLEMGSELTSDDDNTDNAKIEQTDEDMMLSSDSDVNASDMDEDDEEGERELQRQECSKKRKRKVPIVIKKRVRIDDSKSETTIKDVDLKTRRTSVDQLTAESLLTTTRRTSKRASAVANKLKVYEKLSKAEERRKEIQEKLQKRKEKQEHIHKLTQEDRLKIAEETERVNLLSLDKFKEQELSKKQTRLALQQRQKLRFKQDEVIIDYLTTTWQVSPAVEVDDKAYWDEQLQKREKKKKKKYVRRTKKQIEEDNARTLEAERLVNMQDRKETGLTNENPSTIIKEETIINRSDVSETVDSKQNSVSPVIDGEINVPSIEPGTSDNDQKSKDDIHRNDGNSNEINMEPINEDRGGTDGYCIASDVDSLKSDSEKSIDPVTKQVSFVTKPQITMINPLDPPSAVELSKEPTPDMENKSNETPEITLPLKKEETGELEEDKEIVKYEGPYQQVSKNFVTVFKFSTQNYYHASVEIPGYEFLPKSIRNNKNDIEPDSMEPLLRSRLKSTNDDPEALYDEEKANVPVVDTNLVPDLKILDGFPAFGEFDKKVTNEVDVTDIKVESIKITTKAPTGIYINNVKKHCLINNNECQYFDPKIGIPYSDLTSYKIIQDIQKPQGGYKWFGFENGGIYLHVNQKPAKGVPEGF